MIHKNQDRKKKYKMGSIISKPKERLQKKEGLIAQMKTKTEVIITISHRTLPTPHIVVKNILSVVPSKNNVSEI